MRIRSGGCDLSLALAGKEAAGLAFEEFGGGI